VLNVSYPYNAAFMKIFKTFEKKIIYQCQFYCSCLPLHYLIDLNTLNFYSKMRKFTSKPASILYNWFGNDDRLKINRRYDISDAENSFKIKDKIWQCFTDFIKTVECHYFTFMPEFSIR